MQKATLRAIRQCVIAVLLIAVLSLTATASARKLLPVDEGAKDASFKTFRDSLIRAVRQRNTRFVLSVLHPRVHLSFGGHYGKKDFLELWKPDSPKSELWNELSTALLLGGTFGISEGKRVFWAPYTFIAFPDDLDPYEYAAIIGENVRVRSQPNTSASIVTILSYDIVKATRLITENTREVNPRGWVRVAVPDGRNGYVASKYIRWPIEYRLSFERIRGKWLITAFIGGD
ncbi:MAG: SH3 domain-containing protein [Pyrinomonadaceae bacterium]|nr:SH3 domain-containing protein [Pyrinomonadaceae bacterium]